MRNTLAALLSLALVACSQPAAQQPPPTTRAAAIPSGSLPDGWKARLDDPAAKPDTVSMTAEKDAIVITTGPAGIYYKPDVKAEKDYSVSASFSYVKPVTEPQPYGLVVSGVDLDKERAQFTAFMVRSDGKFRIVQWSGGMVTPLIDWTDAPPMRELKGVKTTNTLEIRAMQDAVHFLIGDKELQQMPRARVGGDGIAGVRIGPGLTVQVTKFEVKKFP